MKLKIQSYLHRKEVVSALTEEGYRVSVTKSKHGSETDYYVEIEERE